MLQRRKTDEDTVMFESEINGFRTQVHQHRWVNQAVIAAAVVLPMVSLAVPSTPRFIKGMSLLLGSVFGYASYTIAKMREDEEKIYASYLDINKEQYKRSLASEMATTEVYEEITNQINLRKSMATLPPQAQLEYAEIYGIPQGLYADLFSQPVGNTDVLDDSSSVGHPIDGGVMKNKVTVHPLVQRYPQYVRDGHDWIDELVSASTHPDMNLRHNHHYGIFGFTQDGKTTLAGHLVNLLSSRQPTTVICHDAKNTPGNNVNDWSCEFTVKIDGYENTDLWCDTMSQYVTRQLNEAGGVTELVIIQDEANTVYGRGRGGAGVSPRLATRLLGEWQKAITNLAGCRGHMVFLGQSPLSTDVGLTTMARDNMCLLVLGKSTSYVLDKRNIGNFIRNGDRDMVESLSQICNYLLERRERFALVIPTRGQPFVGLIPNLRSPQSSPPSPTPPQESNPLHSTPESDIIIRIREWYHQCLSEGLSDDDMREDIRKLWKQLTGELLTDDGLDYLMSIII